MRLASAPPRRILATIAGAALLGIAIAAAQYAWEQALDHPGPLPRPRAIVVPKGTTTQLAQALTTDGLITRPYVLQAAAWLTRADGTLHAAEFAFPAHASIREVLSILRTAHPVEHHLTIPEGLTAQQITTVLSHAEAMTGEVPTIAEGQLLPQTYDYEYGANRTTIIARATAAMEKDLAAAWADRAPDLPLSTARDAVILASIVERETAKPDERPHVAAVYLNRLRQGMKLQADPTVVYMASNGAGALDHPITRTELAQDGPFNTYRNQGLPPAPICSPGADSLHAVLHPATSEDLFFVADGTGGHVFSRNYQAHDTAVARYRSLAPSATRTGPD